MIRYKVLQKKESLTNSKIFLLAFVLFLFLAQSVSAQPFQFRHHIVDAELPGDAWGQTALADLDGDGDLDFITGRKGDDIRWYEYQKGASWNIHILGKKSPSDVGGEVLDVNGDGFMDFVTGGVWYLHPGDAKKSPWKRNVFDAELTAVHDVTVADVDGDGRKDVITMSDRNDLRWYRIARDPEKPWEKQSVTPPVHAGLSAGDLDGDGDVDIIRSTIWMENLGKGKKWKEHQFCGIPWADRKEIAFYYMATKSCPADINKDGRMDIVLTEAEFAGARVAWFEAPENPREGTWTPHILTPAKDEIRGPYHSLQVADFDNDGDLDIFSGDMETLGKPPYRWFIWENRSGDGSQFIEHVIFNAGLGTHEAVAGDVDGDGDIDLVGKLWRPVPQNSNEGKNHVDFLENLLISK